MNPGLVDRIQNDITKKDLSGVNTMMKHKKGLGWKSRIFLVVMPTAIALTTTLLFILALLGYIKTSYLWDESDKGSKSTAEILKTSSPSFNSRIDFGGLNPNEFLSVVSESSSTLKHLSETTKSPMSDDVTPVFITTSKKSLRGRQKRKKKNKRRKKCIMKKSSINSLQGSKKGVLDEQYTKRCNDITIKKNKEATKLGRNQEKRRKKINSKLYGSPKPTSPDHPLMTSHVNEQMTSSNITHISDVILACNEINEMICKDLLPYQLTPLFRSTGFTRSWTLAASMTSLISRELTEQVLNCDKKAAERFVCALRHPQCKLSNFSNYVTLKLPCKTWCISTLESCASSRLLDQLERIRSDETRTSRRVEDDINLIATVCELITAINPDEKMTSAEDCYEGDDVSTSQKAEEEEEKTLQIFSQDSFCKINEFQCSDKRCIDARWRCDGNKDCNLWEDEKNCECTFDQYQCASGQCISDEKACDGFEDCFDSSDERNCVSCKEGLQSCGNGQCVLVSWWCDGDIDCRNEHDEKNCSCEQLGLWSCDSRQCISNSLRCDGRLDCEDQSDEEDCGLNQFENDCRSWEIPCGKKCISVSHRCDGTFDCPGKSDEVKCGRVEQVKMKICSDSGFREIYGPNFLGHKNQEETILSIEYSIFTVIAHTKCHPLINHLSCSIFAPQPSNKHPRMSSGRDQYSKSLPCRSLCEKVRSSCLPSLQVASISWPRFLQCETFPDYNCLDEDSFKAEACPISQLRCPGNSTRCIGERARCDGFKDCEQGIDEIGCSCTSLGRVQCRLDGKCVPKKWICDSHQDCSDGSDELGCESCVEGEKLCKNFKCLPATRWCDGVIDCQDGSDEAQCIKLTKEPTIFLAINNITSVEDQNSRTGYLIGYNGLTSKWVPVCHTSWNERLAHLSCKQMGFGKAIFYSTLPYQPSKHSQLSRLPINIDIYRKTDKLQLFFDQRSNNCENHRFLRLECKQFECGRRLYDNIDKTPRRRITKRILNGRTSRDKAWPWLASLHLRGVGHVCGASLLTADWLISAAHCFQEREQPEVWNVVIREIQGEKMNTRSFNISRVIIHPRFEPTTVDFDIAMIKLNRVVPNTFGHPICLPELQISSFNSGSFCVIAGWGLTGRMLRGPNKLQDGSVHIIDRVRCQRFYPYHRITERMVCAGRAGLVDTCNGDSGGPLMCWNSNHQKWQLAGITSWGSTCRVNGSPGVYTDVKYFIDWIKTHLTIQQNKIK